MRIRLRVGAANGDEHDDEDEGDDAEEAEQDDDGVEAGALPVAAAKVQPHSEFVESERHPKAVEQRTDLAHPVGRLRHEDEDAADRGEKEDAVVEMMDVRAAENAETSPASAAS